MDPDAALLAVLDDARAVLAADDATGTEDAGHVGLAQKVVDLHEWLTKGGHLPQAWVLARHRIVEDAVYATGGSVAAKPLIEHEFEPMPGGDVCMAVTDDDKYTRCMEYEDAHRPAQPTRIDGEYGPLLATAAEQRDFQPTTPGQYAEQLAEVAKVGPVCGGSLGGGVVRTHHNSAGLLVREVQCRGCNAWFETVTGHVPPHPQSRAWAPGCDDGGYK